MNDPEFKIHHVDQWGNIFVYCPVCNEIYKQDGVRNHLNVHKRKDAKSNDSATMQE